MVLKASGEEFFLRALEDLTGINYSTLVEDQEIRQRGITLESSSPRALWGTLSFQSLEELFESEAAPLRQKALGGGVYEVQFSLNRRNFNQLFTLYPPLQGEGFQYFLPEEGLEPWEFLDMLTFIFGDQEEFSDEALRKKIEGAKVELTIKPEGKILSQKGGKTLGDSQWTLSLPILDLLLLEEEIQYSFRYEAR